MSAGWSVWKCSTLIADNDIKLTKLQTLVRVSLASCEAPFSCLIPDADSEPCLACSPFLAPAWHAVYSLQIRCRLHQGLCNVSHGAPCVLRCYISSQRTLVQASQGQQSSGCARRGESCTEALCSELILDT